MNEELTNIPMREFTDVYGRTVVEQPNGSWEIDGINVGPCDQDEALRILSGMAPENWKPLVEPVQITWTFEQFLNRFPAAAQQAIFSSNDYRVRQWVARATAANGISPTDPLVVAGLGQMVVFGLLTTDQVAAILKA